MWILMHRRKHCIGNLEKQVYFRRCSQRLIIAKDGDLSNMLDTKLGFVLQEEKSERGTYGRACGEMG